jgi:hypothetical protein
MNMKLTEALEILKGVKSREGEVFTCFLATGMNPLHLNTFLAAELGLLFADQRIEIQHGLYGDFVGRAPTPGCEISRQAFEARAKIVPIPQ